jgi:ketosteroid isomerase-like protein
MSEEGITDEDIERMKRGFALYNEGDFDGLREFIAPDIVMERVGDLPPVQGWEAFRALQDPDAFAWQRAYPLDWTINGDRALLRLRIHAQGAASGVELDTIGWQVWTLRDGLAVRVQVFTDEADARAAAGLGQNDPP